jgi:hypothetical protein
VLQDAAIAAARKAAENAVAADERFEHMAPAEDLIREFAVACVTDRKSDHAGAFMVRHGQDVGEQICYFGIERLRVDQEAAVAGVRLLPLDHPDIPTDNPLFKPGESIASVAAVPVTGTNKVRMAERARKLGEHALRVLRIALRQQDRGLHPMQLRFRLGTSHAFVGGAGGWQMHDDAALTSGLPADLMATVLSTPVAGLPPAAAKKSINEKALLAVEWLDRAVFTPDPLVATLFRFFALEALLGDKSGGLKNGILALRQMTLSEIANDYWFHPDDTFLQYDEVRSYAVHGEIAPAVTEQQAAEFAWMVRDTLDQYLAVAKKNGFTKRKQLLDLLDDYPKRREQVDWIRKNCSPEWNSFLDSIIVTQDAGDQSAGAEDEQDSDVQPLEGELPSARGVKDGLDQQADVAVVDAGDGLAEADRDVAAEAGGESENPPFPG